MKIAIRKMRFGWYMGWLFGGVFISLPLLLLSVTIPNGELAQWIVTIFILAVLPPFGILILKCVIDEYRSTT